MGLQAQLGHTCTSYQFIFLGAYWLVLSLLVECMKVLITFDYTII